MNTIGRSHTFNSIAEAMGCDPRTVRTWWEKERKSGNELGEIVDGVRVFNDEERYLLVSHHKPNRKKSANSETTVIPYQPSSIELATYTPQTFDIGSALASIDGALGLAFDDTESLVDAIEQKLEMVVDALEAKVSQQEDKVKKDRQQVYRLQAIQDDFSRKTASLGLKSKSLAKEQTSVTSNLQAGIEEVTKMGKPKQQSTDSSLE